MHAAIAVVSVPLTNDLMMTAESEGSVHSEEDGSNHTLRVR
jgi:hypothetical protein